MRGKENARCPHSLPSLFGTLARHLHLMRAVSLLFVFFFFLPSVLLCSRSATFPTAYPPRLLARLSSLSCLIPCLVYVLILLLLGPHPPSIVFTVNSASAFHLASCSVSSHLLLSVLHCNVSSSLSLSLSLSAVFVSVAVHSSVWFRSSLSSSTTRCLSSCFLLRILHSSVCPPLQSIFLCCSLLPSIAPLYAFSFRIYPYYSLPVFLFP